MVRTCILAAALAAGGLVAASPMTPAAAGVSIGVSAGPAHVGYAKVGYREWRRGPRVVYRPYRPYRYGYRAYRAPALGVYPAVGVVVAPAPRAYRRCWINRRGYRVCS
jgi:hypothetical protein